MLAAFRSLYSSGMLSMKAAGTAGQNRLQQEGVHQGCPLSCTLFDLLLMGFLTTYTLVLRQLAFGWDLADNYCTLVHAGNVVLLSWSASRLQLLLNSMYRIFLGLGLVISPMKTELVDLPQALPVLGRTAARFFHSLLASVILA